jgi:hypothetical protein
VLPSRTLAAVQALSKSHAVVNSCEKFTALAAHQHKWCAGRCGA